MTKQVVDKIYITDNYSFGHDGYCWRLYHYGDILAKDGTISRGIKSTTYHSNIGRLAKYIMDNEAGTKDSMEEIIRLFNISSKILAKSLHILLEDKKGSKT